jgi:SfnB family sulfur acquisition oxidoreductase
MLQTVLSHEHLVLLHEEHVIPRPLPTKPAHRVKSDSEALDIARQLAVIFAQGAADRDHDRELPIDLLDRFSESGLWGITVPRVYGGAEVSAVTLAEVFAIIAEADPSLAQLPQNHFNDINAIRWIGTGEQKEYFFAEALYGARFGNAVAEANSIDSATICTRLTGRGGGLILNGTKFYATGALLAHWVQVGAVDDDGCDVVAFVRRDAPGLTVIDDWSGFGQRTTASGTVILDNVRVQPQNVVGVPTPGSQPTTYGPESQLTHASIDLGIARAAIRETLQFVRAQSRPFVLAKVERASDDPLTLFQIGDLEYRLHAAEALIARAGRKVDAAADVPTVHSVADASMAVAEAKIATTEIAIAASSKLFELAGTKSTLAKYSLDRHWRNARTHTLHDPVRWKYNLIGDFHLNGKLPSRSELIGRDNVLVGNNQPITGSVHDSKQASVDAHIIQSDEEAIAIAHSLASSFAESAAERDRSRRLPYNEIDAFSKSGLWGITVPREYGGAAVSNVTLAKVFQIISAADPSIGQIPQNHFSSIDDIRLEGSPEQQRFFFDRILKGDRIGSAFSEAKGKNVLDLQTKLTPADDGNGYLVNGEKFYCTGGLFAHWLPILTIDPGGRQTLAVVSRDAEGLTVADDWSGFGQRTTASGTVIANNVHVAENFLLYTYRSYDRPTNAGAFAQIIQAAIDLGIATAAVQETFEFVRNSSRPWVDAHVERASDDPLLLHEVGDLQYRLHSAEALLERAGQILDKSYLETTESTCAAASIAVAEAKIATTEIAILATNKLFELAGTRSVQEKYSLDRHWRNARTHTLHDPVRWKYHAIGNYYLNGKNPPRHNWI